VQSGTNLFNSSLIVAQAVQSEKDSAMIYRQTTSSGLFCGKRKFEKTA
jgi:hypothetical protein